MLKRHAKKLIVAALLMVAMLGAALAYFYFSQIRITDYPVPERVSAAPAYDQAESTIVTRIGVPLSKIQRNLEADIPRKLWSIDRKLNECVPRETIRVFGKDITRTPKIGCRIVGEVKRGSIRLRGKGNAISITFPVSAIVRARDIGGIIKQETGTGKAVIEILARFSIGSNWQATSKVDLNYRWVNEPGIDLLGQRIKFTNKADKELKRVISKIEKSLEREMRSLSIRKDVEELWGQAFTVESLSEENPPAWLRLTPQSAGVGRFHASNGQFAASVLLNARTEILVGDKPAAPEPVPLGRNAKITQTSGFKASIPILADYAEVEPVILRALKRLAAQGIEREELGQLKIDFRKVTIFPTAGGKIAVGIDATIEPIGVRTGDIWGAAKGEIWLTGTPVTEANSQLVRLQDLEIFGDTDTAAGDLLVRVMASDNVRAEIEKALVEDFAADYDSVLEKARTGIASIKFGKVDLMMAIDSVEHSPIQATSDGLFMVVNASGSAEARLND